MWSVGSRQVGRTRRWGIKSLDKKQQAAVRTVPNTFPGVALPWAAALLKDCDVERHGVDLFNRDPLLLGRLLITLVSLFTFPLFCPAPALPCALPHAIPGPHSALLLVLPCPVPCLMVFPPPSFHPLSRLCSEMPFNRTAI